MKVGFLLSVYNKIDDLMAHLEMFKYYPFEHEIIIVHMMDLPPSYMEEIAKYHVVQIEGYGHYIGPLLSAVAGVRKAYELGLDYVVYRNADDWLFNYDFEQQNFERMKNEGYLCGGYNWLNVGTFHDITLNQLYFHAPSFYKTSFDAESYFKRSPRDFLCEYKMARWLKRTCNHLDRQFYRLPGREQEPGVGWERKDIYNAFLSKHMQIPVGYWERLENNNRFFNYKWQMIGSHDVVARSNYWRKIRSVVKYGKKIEKDKHFIRFLDAARNGTQWNIPSDEKAPPPLPKPDKEPKLFSRKIFSK